MVKKTFLEELAEAIREWFPELEGRALAVSEIDPLNEKTNIPTLPLAVVALVRETYDNTWTARRGEVDIQSDIEVGFMVEPKRYKREDGSETPFWSYYDYEYFRDRLISRLRGSPLGGGMEYIHLDIESTPFSVYLAFRFRRHSKWCDPEPEEIAAPGIFTYGIKPAKTCVATPDCSADQKEPCP